MKKIYLIIIIICILLICGISVYIIFPKRIGIVYLQEGPGSSMKLDYNLFFIYNDGSVKATRQKYNGGIDELASKEHEYWLFKVFGETKPYENPITLNSTKNDREEIESLISELLKTNPMGDSTNAKYSATDVPYIEGYFNNGLIKKSYYYNEPYLVALTCKLSEELAPDAAKKMIDTFRLPTDWRRGSVLDPAVSQTP